MIEHDIKLVCKEETSKGVIIFLKNNIYSFTKQTRYNGRTCFFYKEGDYKHVYLNEEQIKEYFYTIQELRKEKIKKLLS